MRDLFLELESIEDVLDSLNRTYNSLSDFWEVVNDLNNAFDKETGMKELKVRIDNLEILHEGLRQRILELGKISPVDFIWFLSFFGKECMVCYSANFYLITDINLKHEVIIYNRLLEDVELFVRSGNDIIENPSFAHIINNEMYDFMKFYINLKDTCSYYSIYDAYLLFREKTKIDGTILK